MSFFFAIFPQALFLFPNLDCLCGIVSDLKSIPSFFCKIIICNYIIFLFPYFIPFFSIHPSCFSFKLTGTFLSLIVVTHICANVCIRCNYNLKNKINKSTSISSECKNVKIKLRLFDSTISKYVSEITSLDLFRKSIRLLDMHIIFISLGIKLCILKSEVAILS